MFDEDDNTLTSFEQIAFWLTVVACYALTVAVVCGLAGYIAARAGWLAC